MGQVLGFSHCQEYGSVASTPDSTPPCTDGGNEESELCELQTAREWSDDEDEGDGDPDDDEGLASSPSIWGTPRQNSFELTFSYIAIAEPEAVGSSRHLRDRRRGSSRGSRTSFIHTDTLETLLDSPDIDWDPQGFVSRDEESEGREQGSVEVRTATEAVRREQHRQTETITIQPSPNNLDPDTQARDAGIQRQESPRSLIQIAQHPSSQHQSPSQILQVMDLIYWKDMERTGMILTGLVVGLLSLFQLSIITVISTVSLAVVCFTISVRIYYQVLYILNWGNGEHPFKSYLDLDISFSGEEADLYMQKAIVMVLSAVDSLKGLFFVKNLLESIKLLVLVYLVTYLGDLCNGLTLFIIIVIALFSLPLFYRQRQEQVNLFFAKIQAKIDNLKDTFQRLAQGGGPPPDPTPGGAKPKTQ
ncbi:reticulon-2a isoform X3 [Anarrhichthys ocellatus]|uniref:reticulon-2a isoform X3 n=1 Tax=Anarrhichthys ocellatus TaxID=433405 RepID=UPI0012ED818E|nr:reticulon-2-like isoform X3 [Anarrhichthys ocellatus]